MTDTSVVTASPILGNELSQKYLGGKLILVYIKHMKDWYIIGNDAYSWSHKTMWCLSLGLTTLLRREGGCQILGKIKAPRVFSIVDIEWWIDVCLSKKKIQYSFYLKNLCT